MRSPAGDLGAAPKKTACVTSGVLVGRLLSSPSWLDLDCSCFACCGSEVAVFVAEAPNDGAVPVVVV
jgi:hypothetical protein